MSCVAGMHVLATEIGAVIANVGGLMHLHAVG